MNILFVETKSTVFGGQKALLARCAELDRRGVEYTVVHPYDKSIFADQYINSKCKGTLVKPSRSGNLFRRAAFISASVIRICRKSSVDLIHLDAFDSAYVCALLKVIGLVGSVPLVFTVRSERYVRFNIIDKIFLKIFSRIATNSEYSASLISANGGVARPEISVTYSPIDFDGIKQPARGAGMTDRIFRIGYFGSLDRRKRLDKFIDFASRLSATAVGKFEFYVYGLAKTKDQIAFLEEIRKKISAAALEAQITFRGYGSVSEAAGEIDVLFCPFDNEPLGRVVPEFLYAGCPVVVVDKGGLVEAGLGHAIVLEPAREESHFEEIIGEFVAGVRDRETPEDARLQLREFFSSSAVVDREFRVYELAKGAC